MTAQIINGKEISMSLRKDIASRVDEIKKSFILLQPLQLS